MHFPRHRRRHHTKRPRALSASLKSSCFSASPSKSDNRKPPAGQPSADHASAFLHSLGRKSEIQTKTLHVTHNPFRVGDVVLHESTPSIINLDLRFRAMSTGVSR